MEVEIGRGKKARRAYGFDDIAIVPSRRTRDPDDVDISWKLGDYRFELPLLASAMDGVVSPQTAGIIGKLGGLAVLNLEGIFTRYEDADEQLERIAQLPKDAGHARDAGDLPRADQARADRAADPRDQGSRASSSPASLTPQRVRRHYELALDAGLDILVIQGTVVSAEHVSSDKSRPPLNLKEFIREVPRAGRRRRLRQLPHGPAPHAHRRGRRARRRRPRRGVHDARRARASASRRRRRSPTSPAARSQHMLETGEYVPGHRRRRHAQRRRRLQGDRLRRRRRDDRLAAGARLRGAGPRLPLGHGDVPPDAAARRARARPCRTARSRRSSSAPRTRTTARSTSWAGCAPRWRPAATRTSRSSTAPS